MHGIPIHIVTNLQGLRGGETHAASLMTALKASGRNVTLWSDKPGPYVGHFGGVAIQPFSKILPRGGTLIVLGAYVSLLPWIEYAHPQRLILICNSSDPTSLHTTLARLQHPSLPPVEMVYVSQRLSETVGISGRICPTLVDLDIFQPKRGSDEHAFTIGRISRDTPEKHHPDDPSIYRLLAWQGTRVRIMGGSHLGSSFAGTPGIEVLPAGKESAATFLQTLDVFFYRTREDWHEPSGRVIMEALACGLPVVGHISGGYTDWIRHGENGFLFKSQEEAYNYLQSLKHDASLRTQLSTGARTTALNLANQSSQAATEYLDWLSL